jgi:hypothetical protein
MLGVRVLLYLVNRPIRVSGNFSYRHSVEPCTTSWGVEELLITREVPARNWRTPQAPLAAPASASWVIDLLPLLGLCVPQLPKCTSYKIPNRDVCSEHAATFSNGSH